MQQCAARSGDSAHFDAADGWNHVGHRAAAGGKSRCLVEAHTARIKASSSVWAVPDTVNSFVDFIEINTRPFQA